MRAIIVFLTAFLFLGIASCDKVDDADLIREKVVVNVQFNLQNLAGDPIQGITVKMYSNKENIFSGATSGTHFRSEGVSDANGAVRWNGISYNINSEEMIHIQALALHTVLDTLTGISYHYNALAGIYYVYGDSPGYLKKEALVFDY